jgi:catechol 2,3-dioxygenase-like lactoylglutathione lyase family enzyme
MRPPDLRLDHVVFPVRDAARTLAFYRDVLELPLVQAISGDDWDGYPWLMMIFGLDGGAELVTVALRGAPAPDYSGLPIDARHYALAASSRRALERWRDRLAAAGLHYWEEQHGEQSSLYFPDPDGVVIEITWPPSHAAGAANLDAALTVERWLVEQAPA